MGAPNTTPGPWKVGGRHTSREFIGGDTSILPALGHAGPVAIAAGIANAHQIAASSELYDALEAVDLARNTDAPADWKRATLLTDAAFRKARGETA